MTDEKKKKKKNISFMIIWKKLISHVFYRLIFCNRENADFVQYVNTAKPNVIQHNQSYMLFLIAFAFSNTVY